VDLQNDYTTGDNRYPKNRQQTLHLPDKYSKTIVAKANQSEGSSFAQKGGKAKNKKPKGKDNFDKEYWNDKTCFKCGKGGHPATHCPNSNDEDDTKSRSSQAKSVKKLEKEVKSMKKAFAQLKETKDDSEISDSDSSQGESHFQTTGDGLQFTQGGERVRTKNSPTVQTSTW
jgi:hypothetical protein